jgi:hypothetical protein
MNASKLILLVGLFAIITAEFGFAQNTPAPTATVEPDPIKSFKELVRRFPTRSIGKSGKTAYDITEVTFDVKKTDSLMTPVIGIIKFSIPVRAGEGFDIKRQMVFHWQGDRWTFERLLEEDGSEITANTDRGEAILGTGPMSDFLKSVQ